MVGTLKLGLADVTLNQVITLAEIPDLKYTPGLDANGADYAAIKFAVTDSGSTDDGGVITDQSPNAITFSVTPVNDKPPNADPDCYIGTEDAALSIDAAHGVLSNDHFYGGPLSVKTVELKNDVNHGTLVLNQDGSFTYTPYEDFNGRDSFTYKVYEDGVIGNTAKVNLTVKSVNDAPAGADKSITMLEDGTYTLKVADFGFSDPKDSPENALAGVKITTLENAGSLKLNGVDVDLNKFISVADIKAGKLKFKPAMDANGDGYANFEFAVMDNGGTAFGGKDTDATPNKITFNVTAVNDAPEGHDKTITMLEDGTRILTVADFGFSDMKDSPGNALAGVKITTLENAGALMWQNSFGVWKDVTKNQVISAADIEAGKLKFKPSTDANGSGYATFQFAVIDNGGTANGGVNTDTTPNRITFNVTAVNDGCHHGFGDDNDHHGSGHDDHDRELSWMHFTSDWNSQGGKVLSNLTSNWLSQSSSEVKQNGPGKVNTVVKFNQKDTCFFHLC